MMRKVVGTLIEVGLGELAAENIPEIINAKEQNQAGRTADACGLYLGKIEF